MEPILYQPKNQVKPPRLIDVPTAWNGIESILGDIITRFGVKTKTAIEIGVDYGYSTVALSNYFSRVIGIDTFAGDVHAGHRDDGQFHNVGNLLDQFDNITLLKMDFRDFILQSRGHYDFAHVDIVHEYEPTFNAAIWAAVSADVSIFHDTRSFPDVMRAVGDAAYQTRRKFYEWPECHGLGIISLREPQ